MGRHCSQESSTLKTAITIGNFDGVHRGHVFLLEHLKKIAQALNLKPIVLSFYGHPKVFKEEPPIQYLLTTPDERKKLIQSIGIRCVEFIKLNKKTMEMSPCEFIKEVLIKRYNIKMLFMGFNHHFGKNRKGTPSYVSSLVSKYNFSLMVMPPYIIDGQVVSSTMIRELLREGKVEEAKKLLGRDYKICGKIEGGKKIAGSVLGIKTANVMVSPLKLIPKPGTYAVWVDLDDNIYRGALYIGNNPTLKKEFSVEVHIIDFNKDIYGKTVCVRFVKRLRDDMAFKSIEALKKAILKDIEDARNTVI